MMVSGYDFHERTWIMENTVVIEAAQPERVGIYLRPATRDRLNVYKAKRTLETGKVYSQSDAIDELLVLAVGLVAQG